MFRILILLVLLAVSFYVVKLVLAYWRQNGQALNQSTKKKLRKSNVVECVYCGLYVPEKEAVKHGDEFFCSLKHANQHRE